ARPAAAPSVTIDRFPLPPAGLLTNGRWTMLITERGTGFSRLGPDALTRWAKDPTEDLHGAFIYLRDREGGRIWSAGLAPSDAVPERYEAAEDSGVFTITREDAGIEPRLEVCVVADADVEVRRLTLRNLGDTARTIEVTTCAEIVLHDPRADAAHPAFAKLFVQTSHDAASGALFARRRPREARERHPWLAHALHGPGSPEHEPARARFIGRGHPGGRPRALTTDEPLSGTVGDVLDPVFALRRTVHVAPGQAAEWTWVLAADHDRERALALASRFREQGILEDAWARSRESARERRERAGLSAPEAETAQALGAALRSGWP